jgi:aspartyl-tRNA(Asn)/glutamyl-tRNA(Gln) amidotransferase subunit A
MELHTLSILEITQLLETGKITPEEIFQYFRNRALAGNAYLNAMKSIADMPADFSSSGPLAGIPIGVKDVFAEAGVSISAGSKMLEQFTPPYTSTVVERLKNAGAKSLGVCHMDEYAMGSSGENCAYGPSRNPWATDRVPGGSSSGSAVAVAA